ncbi:MAG: hypothetical protein HY074_03545 [Deltaproteobacteria bacterium]|nr:hypothetical protein [Deltaproteobacteria bacterium]
MGALLWTFPLLMFASIVIGWAAEVTAVRLSAGIALAVLAWLQTAPEFAVEATIAWHQDAHLALANLTGSLRLLLGFGWPMVFFIHWFTQRRRRVKVRSLKLPAMFKTESLGLAFPVLYFVIIYFKGTWTPYDGAILASFYGVYFWMLSRQRKAGSEAASGQAVEEGEGEPWVVRRVLGLGKGGQFAAMIAMFGFGGAMLWVTVHPFIHALQVAAMGFGISDFIFIQWIAPLASEFPEKVTAFNWARAPRKVPYAVVNMLSSVTAQWTLLAGLVPIIFSISAGHAYTIVFTDFQKQELLLTIAQSALTVAILADLTIESYEMLGYFALWAVQFFVPSVRPYLVPVYLGWTAIEAFRLTAYRRLFLKI